MISDDKEEKNDKIDTTDTDKKKVKDDSKEAEKCPEKSTKPKVDSEEEKKKVFFKLYNILTENNFSFILTA